MNTLVLLPGMDGTGTLFDPLVNALAGSVQTKVVAYPPAGPNGYDALQKFAEAALPVDEPVIVLGESFSGPIAVSLAAKYPQQVRGVVLCCTFVQNPHPLLAPLKCLAALAPIKQLPMAITAAALLGRHATPELRGSLDAALAMVSSAVLRERLRSVLSVDVSEDLAKVTAPILYLRATEDRLIPKQAGDFIKKLRPSTQVVEIVGPHCLLQAASAATAQVIREFIRDFNATRHQETTQPSPWR